jgi:hypothetical protein
VLVHGASLVARLHVGALEAYVVIRERPLARAMELDRRLEARWYEPRCFAVVLVGARERAENGVAKVAEPLGRRSVSPGATSNARASVLFASSSSPTSKANDDTTSCSSGTA